MLQKLEDFYLAILRFVVIFVAGALLVAVVWFGIRSVGVVDPAPEPVDVVPTVSQSAIKHSVLGSSLDASSGPAAPVGSVDDPNQAYYSQAAAAMKRFLETNFPSEYDIDEARLAAFTKSRAEAYESTGMTSVFARSFSENIGALLSDKDLVAYAQQQAGGEVLDRIFDAFIQEFDQQVAATEAEKQAKQEAYLSEKADSMQSLYFAGVAFGIFLMIVFLSIIIRIERNLRPQTEKNGQVRAAAR